MISLCTGSAYYVLYTTGTLIVILQMYYIPSLGLKADAVPVESAIIQILFLAPSFDADCEEGEGPAEPEDIDTLIRSQFRERGGGGGALISRRAGTARSLTSLTMGVGQYFIISLSSNFSYDRVSVPDSHLLMVQLMKLTKIL